MIRATLKTNGKYPLKSKFHRRHALEISRKVVSKWSARPVFSLKKAAIYMFRQPDLSAHTKPHVATTFDEFREKLKDIQKSPPWTSNIIYRGHEDAKYPLSSTLERLVAKLNGPGYERSGGIAYSPHTMKSAEDWLLREFRRGFHHHSQVSLRADDQLGWLAFMQHHGTPTRLLDWTLSPYVALYFAIQAGKPECAVWAHSPAILDDWCTSIATALDVKASIRKILAPVTQKLVTSNSNLEERHRAINELLKSGAANTLPLATVVRPFQMNLRVAAQQGVFSVPLSNEISLEECLFHSGRMSKSEGALMHKITIKDYNRRDMLSELKRMNITHQTLFPGLDGFAKSLEDQLAISSDRFFL